MSKPIKHSRPTLAMKLHLVSYGGLYRPNRQATKTAGARPILESKVHVQGQSNNILPTYVEKKIMTDVTLSCRLGQGHQWN